MHCSVYTTDRRRKTAIDYIPRGESGGERGKGMGRMDIHRNYYAVFDFNL